MEADVLEGERVKATTMVRHTHTHAWLIPLKRGKQQKKHELFVVAVVAKKGERHRWVDLYLALSSRDR